MADCLYKKNIDCIKVPVEGICANCRIRLVATDAQFAAIDWRQQNGFVMVDKSCHTCEYGVYESKKEFHRAMILICEKIVDAKHNGEIIDPKMYVCNLWKQGDMEGDIW